MRQRLRVLLSFSLSLAAACGPDGGSGSQDHSDGDPCSASQAAPIRVGTGPERPPFRFTPLPADLTMSPGGQGGFHVALMLASDALPADVYRARYRVERASDGLLVSRLTAIADFVEGEGEVMTDGPILVFLCPTPPERPVIDEPLRFSVDILGRGDCPIATATAAFTTRCPTGASAETCANICSGN